MKLKRAGRPPLAVGDPSVHVGVTLPGKQFDALCTHARREDLSVPEVIRRAIADAIAEKKSKK